MDDVKSIRGKRRVLKCAIGSYSPCSRFCCCQQSFCSQSYDCCYQNIFQPWLCCKIRRCIGCMFQFLQSVRDCSLFNSCFFFFQSLPCRNNEVLNKTSVFIFFFVCANYRMSIFNISIYISISFFLSRSLILQVNVSTGIFHQKINLNPISSLSSFCRQFDR